MAGRLRTGGWSASATSSSARWFLEQLRHEAGVYIDWDVLRDLPPIARKLFGLLENDRFEPGDDGEEWQAYWLGPAFFASVGSTCARERDNVAALMRACDAIAGHPGTGYRFTKERVATDDGWGQQLLVHRPAGAAGRRAPARPRPRRRLSHRAGPRRPVARVTFPGACVHACTHRMRGLMEAGGHPSVAANMAA